MPEKNAELNKKLDWKLGQVVSKLLPHFEVTDIENDHKHSNYNLYKEVYLGVAMQCTDYPFMYYRMGPVSALAIFYFKR